MCFNDKPTQWGQTPFRQQTPPGGPNPCQASRPLPAPASLHLSEEPFHPRLNARATLTSRPVPPPQRYFGFKSAFSARLSWVSAARLRKFRTASPINLRCRKIVLVFAFALGAPRAETVGALMPSRTTLLAYRRIDSGGDTRRTWRTGRQARRQLKRLTRRMSLPRF